MLRHVVGFRGWILFGLASFTGVVLVSAEQARTSPPSRGVLDVLVFYASPPDLRKYPSDVRRELQRFIGRSRAYRPRARPASLGPEMQMVYNAREGYEGKLFAATTIADASRLAQQYVDALKPCYEWEGFHDCPEREAEFAQRYVEENPNGPFAEFLRLLVAHRWLCAADGYDHEKKPEQAARSRLKYDAALSLAARSRSPLIRAGAEELKASGRCYASDPFLRR